MSKRLSTSQRADTKKRRTVQTSLYKFFDSDSASKLKTGVNPPAATHAQASASTSRALTVPGTPQEFGIHVYTQAQIESSKGMLKDYRLFWNDKVYELCSDVSVREKLKDKSAIQGAINVSWTMQKSSLLQIQADEGKNRKQFILILLEEHIYLHQLKEIWKEFLKPMRTFSSCVMIVTCLWIS